MRAFYGYKALKVYQLSYRLAMEIFQASQGFPKEERYSLTDQIRRASRGVAANIAEGYRKRRYAAAFTVRLIEADSEAAEVQVWLDFARDCRYLSSAKHEELAEGYAEVGRMLSSMIAHPERFSRVS